VIASIGDLAGDLLDTLGYVGLVVLGRMVPGIRSAVSIPPGLPRMPFGRCLALTFAGSLVWNAALILAGQQLGSRWS
jgi:membrane protein DedA with SNARE-associated domain